MYPFLRTAADDPRRARKMPPLEPFGTHVMTLRCWPWDADMFWEMNNGRILTLLRPRPVRPRACGSG
jgi:hypothetical protein